ncbi:MAG: aminotransferase class I/II-fold pyridoxal phosphate-dependent enzyme [Christensenellales bacterium]
MNYDSILSSTAKVIPPSGIRKFFDIASEMKNVISLGVGEPDFVTPWNCIEAAIYSLEQGMTHYTANRGMTELREEIAEYMKSRFQLTYDPKTEIMVTVGASEGIDIALRTIINPGDEVLIPEPSYVSYSPCVMLAGGVPVPIICEAEEGFKLRAKHLVNRITPKTKAVILPYPNNPTGGIMEKEYLQEIADVLKGTDIIVISDEIYAELTYVGKHVSFASIGDMAKRTIVLNGFSKAFAMTGWRIGFVCGPAEIVSVMLKIHQYAIMCAPTMSQVAAINALRDGKINAYASVAKMKREYNRRRRYMFDSLNKLGLYCFEPLGAFYIFPSIHKTGLSSMAFCERLLMEQKVAVVPGTAFGSSGEGFVRCSYASSMENLMEAVKRIEHFISCI